MVDTTERDVLLLRMAETFQRMSLALVYCTQHPEQIRPEQWIQAVDALRCGADMLEDMNLLLLETDDGYGSTTLLH